MNEEPSRRGMVYLIGAGPGDPKLITVRGVECLKAADVVYYDYLANPQLLRHARPNARCVCLGGHREGRIWSQLEINEKLVHDARQGLTVARLKGGDPSVFSRGAEEAEYLQDHEIDFEFVPGVTAALAASAYTGIPITHRDLASTVAFVTGQQQYDSPAALDYRKLAQFPGTLVFYMGVTSAKRWASDLVAAGKAPDTPVAVVRHVSLPTQLIYRCQLDEVADLINRERLRPPILSIVGPVAELEPVATWFTNRPLRGTTVLVTRSTDQAGETIERLESLGAEVLTQPAIEIRAAAIAPLQQVLARIDQFDWIVFSSANGVRYFFHELLKDRDLRRLGSCRLASIGPSTDEALGQFHLHSDLIPQRYVAEQLAEELAPLVSKRSVLLVRASRGREVLVERLRAAGAEVEQVVAYDSCDTESASPEIQRRMDQGEIDWVTVTSSAIAQSLGRLFGESLRNTKLASISPVTTATLESLNHTVAVEASEYNTKGVVDAILATAVK